MDIFDKNVQNAMSYVEDVPEKRVRRSDGFSLTITFTYLMSYTNICLCIEPIAMSLYLKYLVLVSAFACVNFLRRDRAQDFTQRLSLQRILLCIQTSRTKNPILSPINDLRCLNEVSEKSDLSKFKPTVPNIAERA